MEFEARLERGGGRVGCYAHLGWDAAPSRSGAGARTASERRPSARNGSLPPPIKGAAAADNGADNPVSDGHRAADHVRPHNGLPVVEGVSRAHGLTSSFGSSATRNRFGCDGATNGGFAHPRGGTNEAVPLAVGYRLVLAAGRAARLAARKRPLCWRRRSFAVSLGGVDAVETGRRAGGAVPDGLGSRRELGGAARRGSSS